MTIMPSSRVLPAGALRLDPRLAEIIPARAEYVLMRDGRMLSFAAPPQPMCPKKAKRWRIIRAQRRNEVMRLIQHRGPLSRAAQCDFAVAIASVAATASVVDHLEAVALFRRHCPALTDDEREDILSEAIAHPFRWTAREFGELLHLTKPERKLLKIRTFRAEGVSRDEMEADNRRQNAAHQRAKRALNAKPKPVSLRMAKPWVTLGMSESKFYRLKREGEIVVDLLPDGSTAVRHIRRGTILLLTPVLPRGAAAPEGAAPMPSTKSRAGASGARRTKHKAKSPAPMKATASSSDCAAPARGRGSAAEGARGRFFPRGPSHAARAAPISVNVSTTQICVSLRRAPADARTAHVMGAI